MTKKKTQSSSKKQAKAFGIILIGIGLLLFLSIISFDRQDNPNLDLENNSLEINNWLGRVGAYIAQPAINFTLGYPIIVIPILLIIFGIQIFRLKPLTSRLRITLFLIMWSVLISIFLAIPESFGTNGNIAEYYPSGMVGGEITAFLVSYLSKFGAGLAIFFLTLALLVLTIQIELSFILTYISDLNAYLNKILKERKARKIKEKQKKKEKKKFEFKQELQIKTNAESDPTEKLIEKEKPHLPPFKPIEKPVPSKPVIETPAAPAEIKKEEPAQVTQKEEQPETSNNNGMDFEVKAQAKVEEVDYDQLVRESVAKYEFPSIDLLHSKPSEDSGVSKEELKANALLLEQKLMTFGIQAKVISVTAGPVITFYELQPAPGIRVGQITALANDLALAMEARGIRMVAPIPGKAAIGIEIPNKKPQVVYLKSLIKSEEFAESDHILPLALGKTINGRVYCADLTKMPHLLIAGATGSGKSVGINTILSSIIYKKDPGRVKFVLIDPKKIELSLYRDLKNHFLIWRTDLDEEVITKPKNAVSVLNSIILEMEKRYDMLASLGVRNIEEYNKRVKEGGPRVKQDKLQRIPYIVVIVDELADLMMVAAKEVESPIARLAQMARAVGIHLILATQRPSVDVITGTIKANFPARIAYMVTARPDSKTILDRNGAEQLLGNGDMLFVPPGEPREIRLQNPLVTTEEVTRIIKHIRKQPKLPHYGLPQPSASAQTVFDLNGDDLDEHYEEAKKIVILNQSGSISLLQRRLKIGYARAARLIDMMEEEGIVGPSEGGKPRQVLMQSDDM